MASRFCLLLVFVIFAFAECAPKMSIPGGWSEWENANERVKEICKKMEPEVTKKTGENFSHFEALTYQTQVVAGVNYRIKVYAGVNKLVIMQVYQDLQQVNHLSNLEVVALPNANFST